MAPLPGTRFLYKYAVIRRFYLYVSPGEHRLFCFASRRRTIDRDILLQLPVGLTAKPPLLWHVLHYHFNKSVTPAHGGKLRFYFHSATDTERRLPGVRFLQLPPHPAASEKPR